MALKLVNFFVRICLLILVGLILTPALVAAPKWADFDSAAHDYWNRPLNDDFSRLKDRLEAGELPLDYRSEKGFLNSLLKALDIPASSQTMLYSTTSLQLRLISVRNPRTIYFNEDLYVGFVPRGRIEVVALNPELGGVYYIFDIPQGQRKVTVERSTRCMNCHAGENSGYVPGLLVRSVIPGPNGGSLDAFRGGEYGHDIPLSERFGGWHVTGADGFQNHHGNQTGRFVDGEIETYPLRAGSKFTWAKYPVRTSDILTHLVFEHQVGFVNKVLEATYRTRAYLHEDQGKLTDEHASILDDQAKKLVRYILFADEAELPKGGFAGDAAFKQDFRKKARRSQKGASLREFDLQTRMFKYRCSYMIHSAVFSGLPAEMKARVMAGIRKALDGQDKEFNYLPAAERQTIRAILSETFPPYSREG